MDYCISPMSTLRVRNGLLCVACLLCCIRVLAVTICSACFAEFESSPTRGFYLHDGSDHDACHHGRAPVGPFATWACQVTQDAAEFVLPDIPRLPVIVSFFVPLSLLMGYWRDRLLLAGKGRSPPLRPLFS
ncbi:MAG: conserved exported protein of unknown function [Nitrospira sp.]|nr:MAG: conserved exported protein of unknown function [Nitrospira sp.]